MLKSVCFTGCVDTLENAFISRCFCLHEYYVLNVMYCLLGTRVRSITSFQFNYNYNYNYVFNSVNYIATTIILCYKYQITNIITITFTFVIDHKLKLQILLRIWKYNGNRLIEHQFIEQTAYSISFGWTKKRILSLSYKFFAC